MSKKLWIIVGVVVVVILIGGYFLSNMVMSGLGYKQNSDGTQTYTNEQGSITVGENVAMPENWPSDAPANFTGATIISSGVSSPQTGTLGSYVIYTVSGSSIADISKYYQDSLVAQGWEIQGTADLGLQTIVGAKKDTRTFGASISDNGDGTITVTAGLEL